MQCISSFFLASRRSIFWLAFVSIPSFLQAASPDADWVGAWGAGPTFPVGAPLNNQTVREFVRMSHGGTQVRIRLSNETATEPVRIGSVHLALGAEHGAIKSGTDHIVTFQGQTSVTIPAGAPALSDPIPIQVEAFETLAISLFFPKWIQSPVVHYLAQATTYLSPQTGDHKIGDQTANIGIETPTKQTMWYYLSGVDVSVPKESTKAVVTFGDSITDGYGSTVDGDSRWPDQLAERFKKEGMTNLSVVNEGISGNRILHDLPLRAFGPNALSRFDRDVLSVANIGYVIALIGINDIGVPGEIGYPDQTVSSNEIIAGYKQLIDRAHQHHVKIFGATLLPYADTAFSGYYSTEGETKRQAVNRWIRTSQAFDGVIDFEAVVRDPGNPTRLKAEFDCGDHLHPNDAGYKAMANAVDLELFGHD
jgi:lysophospholipase L1-like esterase